MKTGILLRLKDFHVGKVFMADNGTAYKIIRWDSETLALINLNRMTVDEASLSIAIENRLFELCSTQLIYDFSNINL